MTDKPPSSRLCCPKNLPKKVYNCLIYHPKRNDLAFRSPSMWIKFSRNSRPGIDACKVKSLAVHRSIVVNYQNYNGQVFVYTKELKMQRREKTLNLARTYLYACWLCFWFLFFRMKRSTDFYDFWNFKKMLFVFL